MLTCKADKPYLTKGKFYMKNLKINEERNENDVIGVTLIDKVRKNKVVIGICSSLVIAITAAMITVSGATTSPATGEDGVIATPVAETMLITTPITTTTTKVSSSSTTSTTTSLTTSTSKETTETTTTTTASTTEKIMTTIEEPIVVGNNPIEDVDETVVEVNTYVEDNTTTTTPAVEYFVYKPSSCYVHKNTCRWVDSTCYEITSTDGIESRKCSECNPDIEIVSEYTTPAPVAVSNTSGLTSLNYITDEERIMLCNVVGGEYGSDWVSLYDKACVVAVVMNRYYDGGWQGAGRDNTISNILSAPGQFAGYYANTTYNSNVTQSCKDAVEYYFENQSLFPHYISFWGDGTYNHFS